MNNITLNLCITENLLRLRPKHNLLLSLLSSQSVAAGLCSDSALSTVLWFPVSPFQQQTSWMDSQVPTAEVLAARCGAKLWKPWLLWAQLCSHQERGQLRGRDDMAAPGRCQEAPGGQLSGRTASSTHTLLPQESAAGCAGNDRGAGTFGDSAGGERKRPCSWFSYPV